MLVTLKTDKKQLRFNDKIKCTVVIDEIDLGDFHECSFTLLINGLRAETVYKRIGCEANITDITKPIDLEFYPSVFSFDGGIGKNSYVEISLLTRFSGRHILRKQKAAGQQLMLTYLMSGSFVRKAGKPLDGLLIVIRYILHHHMLQL
ncbi:MAG: hypothetical protein GJU72_01990 [Acidithiobacillus ferriphilus]|jgi:hypothetical protein|nr:hypothetical protein [Acidithiobacillus ferriphilus]